MPKFAANLSMLFTELPFLDRFAAAARAGFSAVECQFPYEAPAAEIAARLRGEGLTLVLHNLPPGDWTAGDRGVAIFPDRRQEFRDGVARALDYAVALGCDQLNCLAGVAPEGADRHALDETFAENLAFAAGVLNEAGIKLLIEPINTLDMPRFHLNRTRHALDLITASGSDNVFVQYDAYHMQIMEGDLARTLERHIDRIAHVQVADNPGRHEPGTGEINFPFLFAHLDRIGYRGWVGCEYRPAAATEDGLGWLRAAS
ncbi:hydroxypyruvate isomerase [Hansschlegelia sp. KR7-227]|uniref:hydroxypyruvate isomerase n=1 Tax=Hansschlegelia sp. KR7-227 TaxID=3400914 RepID=UPI003C0AAE6F